MPTIGRANELADLLNCKRELASSGPCLHAIGSPYGTGEECSARQQAGLSMRARLWQQVEENHDLGSSGKTLNG